MATCGASTLFSTAFLGDSINTMAPWLIALTLVVLTDLIAGCRKSLQLGVHVSVSTAARETMGKLVVYWAFVLMVASIEVATGHKYNIAMWGCLLICGFEGLSIVGNILKPMGIDLSLGNIITATLQRVFGMSQRQADKVAKDESIEIIKKREEKKWNQRKSK